MNDMFLVVFLPIVVILLGAIFTVIERRAVDDCKHEYSDWYPYITEHAYVQQKQCKKCQFIYTYQERKIGHERHQHHDVHKG